jgi:hypothetical protein
VAPLRYSRANSGSVRPRSARASRNACQAARSFGLTRSPPPRVQPPRILPPGGVLTLCQRANSGMEKRPHDFEGLRPFSVSPFLPPTLYREGERDSVRTAGAPSSSHRSRYSPTVPGRRGNGTSFPTKRFRDPTNGKSFPIRAPRERNKFSNETFPRPDEWKKLSYPGDASVSPCDRFGRTHAVPCDRIVSQ